MLPTGYKSILICDTRRAQEWRAGLRQAGLELVMIETEGLTSEKGAWELAVPEAQELAAKAFVAKVIQGRLRLPRAPFLSGTGIMSMIAIVLIVLVLVLASWMKAVR
ncbi:MAG: hypothetical protein HY698_05540 [Deltaproteobacteria bacterium]|nr:hypothetical protein [Deltaproteobacteria bacterium]